MNSLFPASLKELHLSHNRISNLNTGLFHMRQLQILTLNDNELWCGDAGTRNIDDDASSASGSAASSAVSTVAISTRLHTEGAKQNQGAFNAGNRIFSDNSMARTIAGGSHRPRSAAIAKGKANLAKALSHLSALTDLEIEGNELESLDFLCVTKNPGEAGITYAKAGDKNRVRVPTIPLLHSLSAGRNRITRVGPRMAMPRLQELYLAGNKDLCYLHKADVCAEAGNGAPLLSGLEILDLSDTGLDLAEAYSGDAMKSFMTKLSGMFGKSLHEFYCRGTPLTMHGAGGDDLSLADA